MSKIKCLSQNTVQHTENIPFAGANGSNVTTESVEKLPEYEQSTNGEIKDDESNQEKSGEIYDNVGHDEHQTTSNKTVIDILLIHKSIIFLVSLTYIYLVFTSYALIKIVFFFMC